MNPQQTSTLCAFLTALVELDSPLPTALQHEINKVGEMLANTQNDAFKRLIELAENDCLKESYNNALMNIYREYQPKELNKFDKPSQQNQPPIPEDHFPNIAIPILNAPDSSAEAKKYKSEIRKILNV
ncbi:MAG: hypothetical protein V7L25_35055 [Nostoc sp.]|uniref:hypothetical protein n=1 Tax=Nostoc sp. TaxID=1180 RepID=UPI002FF3C850